MCWSTRRGRNWKALITFTVRASAALFSRLDKL
jgi:hypothetical protein